MKQLFFTLVCFLFLVSCEFNIKLSTSDKAIEASGRIFNAPIVITK